MTDNKTYRIEEMQTTGWELVEPIGQYERLTKEQASAAIEELILEVDKCQLLCRPCHIDKSHEEGDWRKLTDEEKENRIRK